MAVTRARRITGDKVEPPIHYNWWRDVTALTTITELNGVKCLTGSTLISCIYFFSYLASFVSLTDI